MPGSEPSGWTIPAAAQRGRSSSRAAAATGGTGTARAVLRDCDGHFTRGQAVKTGAGCAVAKVVA